MEGKMQGVSLRGGYVLGIGIDLIEIDRIRRAWQRHGERFLSRIFTDEELDYCLPKSDPAPSLAARWAAKEAVAKALGVGLGDTLKFRDVSVRRGPDGKPSIELSVEARAHFGEARFLVSLSHHGTAATAVVAYLGD
jgi:holo-[acyl-carrier protein] synthase